MHSSDSETMPTCHQGHISAAVVNGCNFGGRITIRGEMHIMSLLVFYQHESYLNIHVNHYDDSWNAA